MGAGVGTNEDCEQKVLDATDISSTLGEAALCHGSQSSSQALSACFPLCCPLPLSCANVSLSTDCKVIKRSKLHTAAPSEAF